MALIAIAIPLLAQQSRVYRDGDSWVEEVTGTMPAPRELRVNTDLGNVQVQGNGSQCSYVVRKRSYASSEDAARRQFGQFRFNAVRTGEIDALEGKMASHGMNRFGVEMMVQVPRALEIVRVETGGGSLGFHSLAATVAGTTGGGSVKLDDIGGPVKIKSGGGSVEGGSLGNDFTLNSGGGDVHIESVAGNSKVAVGGGRVYVGSAKSAIIQTGGGSIDVRKCAGDLHANTSGGNVSLGDVNGAVGVESGGGVVHLTSARGRVQVATGGGSVELFKLNQGAQVETGAGDITVEFVGGRGSFTDSSLHTAAGDVVVYLPSNIAATIHAAVEMASGHGIHSDFSEVQGHTESGYGPKSMWAEGTINGGGPSLRVRTTIGQIDFRRSQ
jgi:DUF4097 and DUF4098 domain-containing protein YvlB